MAGFLIEHAAWVAVAVIVGCAWYMVRINLKR